METAASIIAILQLSDKVIKYVRDVSGATEDRKRLREQVRACSSILLMLKDGIEDSEEGQAWAGTVDLLAPPLERLRKALELAAVRLHTETSTKEKLKWPFKEKEVQKFIEAIESEKSLLSLALENNSARLLQQIGIRSLNNSAHLEELTTLLKEHALDSENRHRDLKSKVSTVQDTQISLQKDRSASEEAEKRLKIIEWLSPLDHDAQQHDIISQRQVGTGDWFLNSVQYQEWLETKGGVLFCPGIPGAGKSFLASIAIADVCERYHQDSCIATTFFYFDFRRQQTIENAISSLLKQLVEGATQLSQSIEAYFDHYCKRRTRPFFADVVVAFREELRSYQQVFVIIDALDESQASADLVSTVLDLQRIKQFNLLATSRPLPEISAQFADVVVLPIRATHQDVQTYLEAHIRRLPGFVKSNAKLQEEITESIVRSVQGM
jgi:DNA replication protein DnaC